MAVVTAFTAERMEEIANNTVDSAAMDDFGNLVGETPNGGFKDFGLLGEDHMAPVPVPQIFNVPVILYGHSLTVPVPGLWHSDGTHWVERLVARDAPSSFTNLGFGGVTMEDISNVVTGATANRWLPGVANTLAIVMSVLNSAVGIVPGSSPEISAESMKQAAKAIMVTMLSNGYSWADSAGAPATSAPSHWGVAVTDYGRRSDVYPDDGTLLYTEQNGVWMQYTIPSGYTNRPVWMEVSVQWFGIPQSTVQVTKNGITTLEKTLHRDDSDIPHGSKHMLYVGNCSSGDVIRLTKLSGGLIHHNGFYVGHNTNHVVMIGDIEHIISSGYPHFQQSDVIALHNNALAEAVSEINGLVPDGASFVPLAGDPTYDSATMQWTGDTLHPNDKGMTWYHARVSRMLSAFVPFTGRVHTH